MISSLCWVPRGAAKPVPKAAPVTDEELAGMREEAEDMAAQVLKGETDSSEESSGWETDDDNEMEDEEAAVARARAVAGSMASTSGRKEVKSEKSKGKLAAGQDLESALAELDMDHYDSSEDGVGGSDAEEDERGGDLGVVARALGGKSSGVVLNDPYLQADSDEDEGGVDSEEQDDYVIRQDDLLILAARNEDDVSTLEVWVYEEPSTSTGGEANLYVHHDLLLPAFPLCLAWMDVHPSGDTSKANMVAVGSMDPGIEVWDLDVAAQVEPVITLGGLDTQAAAAAVAEQAAAGSTSKEAKAKAKKKVKKKAPKSKPVLRPDSHTDAVLGLSWNREFRNVLASGSADSTVKVWDVVTGVCETTLSHHTDKVQAVAWNPAEPPVLLTGSFDRSACLVDARNPTAAAASWKVSADVEALAWNPHEPTSFLVTSEDGLVAAFDARKGTGSDPLFRLSAHDKPTCALSFCTAAPGLLATASTDQQVKLWRIASGVPSLLVAKEPKLGALFTVGFCREVPYLLAMAGAKGTVGVWDVRSASQIASAWPDLMKDAPAQTVQ